MKKKERVQEGGEDDLQQDPLWWQLWADIADGTTQMHFVLEEEMSRYPPAGLKGGKMQEDAEDSAPDKVLGWGPQPKRFIGLMKIPQSQLAPFVLLEKRSHTSRNLVWTMNYFHILKYNWDVVELPLPAIIMHHEFLMIKIMTKEKEGEGMFYNNAVMGFI